MQKTKKILSLMLSLLMIMTMMPMSVFQVSAASSGTLENGITWQLERLYYSSKYKLYINGTGEIPDYEYTTQPWYQQDITYTEVVIGEGITRIGESNFDGLYVEKITLPSTLKSIGVKAFDSSRFVSVELPEGLETIEKFAFNNCNFESIEIPSTVKSISENAFMNCRKLKEVKFNYGLETIGKYAFDGSGITSFVIPSSVKSIGNDAFDVYSDAPAADNVYILNPECEIGATIIKSDSETVIHGYKGSTAEEYANNYRVTFSVIDPEACDHSDTTLMGRKEPTCTAIGYEAAVICCYCEKVMQGHEEIPALGHDVTSWTVLTEPTCGIDGKKVAECSRCFTYGTITVDSSEYPESDHFYKPYEDKTYNFSYDGAVKLTITFSDKTETEKNYDYIYLYDGNGTEIGKYSGTELAGKTFEIEGNSFSVKLTSDHGAQAHGFDFSSIVAEFLDETAVEVIPATGEHNWKKGVCTFGCGVVHEHTDEDLEWTTVVPPSCIPGKEMASCSVCGKMFTKDILLDSATYPESKHDYDSYSDEKWNFTYEGAEKFTLTFSEETITEANYDFIYLYDGNGTEIGKYSDTELAGQSVTVEGDRFTIRLKSDRSNVEYGFKLDSITATVADESYIREIPADSDHTPTAGTYEDKADGSHSYTCSVCGEAAAEDHVIDENVEQTCLGYQCKFCGALFGEKNADVHAGTPGEAVPTEDGTQHAGIYDCCGAEGKPEDHEFEQDGTCICGAICAHENFTDGACDVCGGNCETLGHIYVDYKCALCGAEQTFNITYIADGEVICNGKATGGYAYIIEAYAEKEGHILVGWDTDGDGEADCKADGYYDGGIESNMTFVAVFAKSYTVKYYTFNYDTGEYEDNNYGETLAEGDTVYLGYDYAYWYKFLGWATEPYGEVAYQPGDKYTVTGDVIFYAVARPFKATVDLGAFDAYWNDENDAPITVISGSITNSNVTLDNFPKRSGYKFVGFIDNENGSEYDVWTDEETGKRYVDVFINDDANLTAQWEECTEHIFGEYEVYVEATCTASGLEYALCKYGCGAFDEKDIPALNHKDTLVQVDEKAPTCTEIGHFAYEYCTACDYTSYVKKEALGHNWADKDGVCINRNCGYECLHEEQTGKVCEICGKVLHVCDFSGDWLYNKDGHYKQCECGEKQDAVKHDWSNKDGICTVCKAPCTHEGQTCFKCSVCKAERGSDGIPLTIDVSKIDSILFIDKEISMGYYDDDGYILVGSNPGIQLRVVEPSNIEFNNAEIGSIQLYASLNINLKGDNAISSSAIAISANTLTINGGDNDTLTCNSSGNVFSASGNPGSLVINGGKITANVNADSSGYRAVSVKNFTVNGGEVNLNGNIGTVLYIYGKTILNGGTVNVVARNIESYLEAIDSSIEISEGALLTVSAVDSNILIHNARVFSIVGEGNYAYVRYDKESDFVPTKNIIEALKNKAYAEIKVDAHQHEFNNAECICGDICYHANFVDSVCDYCGYECVVHYENTIPDGLCDLCNAPTGKVIPEIKAGETIEVSMPDTSCDYYVKFVAEESRNYIFSSSGEGADPWVRVVDAKGNDVDFVNNEGEDDCHFNITFAAQAGETYWFIMNIDPDMAHTFDVSLKIEREITHQPTFDEPFISINTDEEAEYQWYTVAEEFNELKTEADGISGKFSVINTYFPDVEYNEEQGWLQTVAFNNMYFTFMVELEKGEELKLSFADESGTFALTPLTGNLADNTYTYSDGETVVKAKESTLYMLLHTAPVAVRAEKVTSVLTPIEEETAAEFKGEMNRAETYLCKVFFADGGELISGKFAFEYKIIHQPTVDEPYVETNDENAEYQWFEAEGDSELDDTLASPFDPTALDIPAFLIAGVAEYTLDSGWSPAYVTIDTGYGMYYFSFDIKAGETVTFEFSSMPSKVLVLDISTKAQEELEVEGKTATFTADEDTNYLLGALGSELMTVRGYIGSAATYEAIDGEDSAVLSNLEIGKTYVCEVTFSNGSKKKSNKIKDEYRITHQPTVDEPYIETNDENAEYQWYKTTVEEGAEITAENAETVSYDWGESSYDKENGWSGVLYDEEYDDGYDFFTVELKAGQKIIVELTGEFFNYVGLWDYENNTGFGKDVESGVTSYEFIAEEDGKFTFYTYSNSGELTVKVYFDEKVVSEKVEGQTSARLVPSELGTYYCEVTFSDGSDKKSDSFEVTELTKTGWYEEDGAWYYFDADKNELVTGITRVPYPTESINGVTYVADQETLDYCAKKDKTFIDAESGLFYFDDNGKFQSNFTGILEGSYIENGFMKWHPGLVVVNSEYYYFIGNEAEGGNIPANGDTYITRANGIEGFKQGDVYNFANGKLSGYNGIVDGKYYVNSKLMSGNGLTKLTVNGETKYIYVRSSGQVVINGQYWVGTNSHDILPGMYSFDKDGYMLGVKDKNATGIFYENGDYYFYENGSLAYKGLIKYSGTASDGTVYDNDWIYVRSNGQLATGTYWTTKNDSGEMNTQNYNFDSFGKMIRKNGIIEENGNLYYYIIGVKQKCLGLINLDGNYYYVRTAGELVRGREYWITNVNDTGIVAQCYYFDENGVMQNPVYDKPETANGIIDGYYYVDGKIAYGAGVLKLSDESGNTFYIYVRSNGKLATGIYWPTTCNGLLENRGYDFGTDGRYYPA